MLIIDILHDTTRGQGTGDRGSGTGRVRVGQYDIGLWDLGDSEATRCNNILLTIFEVYNLSILQCIATYMRPRG